MARKPFPSVNAGYDDAGTNGMAWRVGAGERRGKQAKGRTSERAVAYIGLLKLAARLDALADPRKEKPASV
jgi:hypothetical protein